MGVKVSSSRRHSAKGLSKTFDNSVVAMVTDLCRHWYRGMADSIMSLKNWWRMAVDGRTAPRSAAMDTFR